MAENADYRIRLDVQNNVPPQLERVVKQLNKVEKAADAAGRRMSALDRVLGKILPGGGLGNALGDAAGGGLVSTAGVGMAFFDVSWIKGLIDEARAMDLAAKSMEDSMKRITRWSDGAIDGLSSISFGIETLWRLFRKSEGDRLGNLANLGKVALGTATSVAANNGLARLLPQSIRDWLDNFGTMASAEGMLGLTGGSGRQDVAAAEARLKKAQENRDAKKRGGSAGTGAIAIPNVDELARIGLFRAGTPALQSQMTELQRSTNEKLDLLNRTTENLAPRIAAHL